MIKETTNHWLEVAKKINSIAQTGLTFTKDEYDKERYNELLELSISILNNVTGLDSKKLEFIFNRDIGYQTPKVGIRIVVIKDEKILMVREKMDNKWSLPGGYADPGYTPSEIAIKEVKEESGFDVNVIRLLGVIDYNKHQERPFPFDLYQLFIECEIVGGESKTGVETSEVGFFGIDELPELSVRRVTREQIIKMFELHRNREILPIID
jgi:ADP-ribose pyrophosphatase YjhB (NUDIX family)